MAEGDSGADASLTRDLGAQLRHAREQRGLSLRSLAQRVDVSPSLLSQIENGIARPSVGTLWALVSQLGISLDSLFAPAATARGGGLRADPAGPAVQRAGARQVLELSGGVRWEQLDASLNGDVVFALVTYEPGVESDGRPPATHSGREFGYLVSGRLAIEFRDERVELAPGDSVSFDSRVPHRFSALGPAAACAVWFNIAH